MMNYERNIKSFIIQFKATLTDYQILMQQKENQFSEHTKLKQQQQYQNILILFQ